MERISITYDIILLCDSELGDGLGRLSRFLHSTFSLGAFTPTTPWDSIMLVGYSSSRMPGCIIASYLLFPSL